VHQLERVTNLLALLLSTRRHLTFDEIRNELKGQYPENLVAARAAFERDKAILRDEGIPISSEVQGGDKAGITGRFAADWSRGRGIAHRGFGFADGTVMG
jgi:predicted DNA-binding transcriptional regulator YafY